MSQSFSVAQHDDQRTVVRTRISKRAKIALGPVIVQCILRDVTARGACLDITDCATPDLPDRFELSLDNCRSFRHCRVMWRHHNLIGVLF
jgi:hypothetical protein